MKDDIRSVSARVINRRINKLEKRMDRHDSRITKNWRALQSQAKLTAFMEDYQKKD